VISQRPYNQGYEAVKRAYLYLFDGIIPEGKVVNADLSIVTREML
jgi:ABC-type sugar transport system substrate-binding protein